MFYQIVQGSEPLLRLEPSRLQTVPLCHPVLGSLGSDREALELDEETQPFEVLQNRRAKSAERATPSAQHDLVHRLADPLRWAAELGNAQHDGSK